MALVAEVNGIKVYSDKERVAIVDGRVLFADGSWCDAVTGQTHNNGPGYINIGSEGAKTDEDTVTEGPRQVRATSLTLRELIADVNVEVDHDRVLPAGHLSYRITGPASKVQAISANASGGTLVIEGGDSGSGGSIVVNQGPRYVDESDYGAGRIRTTVQAGRRINISGGSGIVIGSGSVMSSSFGPDGSFTSVITTGGNSGEDNDVTVTVIVPAGTAIESEEVSGKVVIGDTDGRLTASANNGNSVTAGRISDGQLSAKNYGSVEVSTVTGNVGANAKNYGKVVVNGGTMATLNASAKNYGSVTIWGTATMAMLEAKNYGSVDVEHVVNPPMRDRKNYGTIHVGRIG